MVLDFSLTEMLKVTLSGGNFQINPDATLIINVASGNNAVVDKIDNANIDLKWCPKW